MKEIMTVKFELRQMVSISDLQRKLGEITEKVLEQDVLVLKNNKPEFIMISPEKYQKLVEAYDLLEQLDIYETIESRRKQPSLNGKQMIKLLGTIEETALTQDN